MKDTRHRVSRDKARIPTHSVFYDKMIPILLIVMAVLTCAFILIAAGILLGLVPFR